MTDIDRAKNLVKPAFHHRDDILLISRTIIRKKSLRVLLNSNPGITARSKKELDEYQTKRFPRSDIRAN